MMIRYRKIGRILVGLAASAVLIAGIAGVQKQLNRQIRENNLFFTGQIDNAPPVVTFVTMALGSFRGVLADMFWLRATSLQQDKNYFEMVQLADWITKLQPRFAGATAFLAWNMAYNVSVTCSLWQDRWYWVWEGIKLIRDEALRYNPESSRLYWELAYIFQHKLGHVMDDANYYYKVRLASETEQVIGLEPDWQRMDGKPSTEEDFMQRFPRDSEFWRRAGKAGIPDYRTLNDRFRTRSRLPEELVEALGDLVAAEDLDATLRAIWLYDRYRLKVANVVALNREYGNMDWRLAESQAIYWAAEGLKVAPHDMQTQRIVAISLQTMVEAGWIRWMQLSAPPAPGTAETEEEKEKREMEEAKSRYLIIAPNLDLVQSAIRTYDWAYEEHAKLESFMTGKVNFMKRASMLLFIFGRLNETKAVYEQLKKDDDTVKYPAFEVFLEREIKETLDGATYKMVTDVISSFLRNALIAAVNGDEESLRTYELMAQKAYQQYQASISSEREKGRRGLAPYENIRNQAVRDFMASADPRTKVKLQSLIDAQKMERKDAAAEEK